MRQPTFPVYPDRCGWDVMLPARRPTASARGRISAKHAIVGAGFTGLAAARRLHELDPGAEIVVLEAATLGEGSSARNSGFLSPTDIASGADPATVSANEARNRYLTEGFEELAGLVARHAIDCDLHQSGRIKAAATASGEAAVRDAAAVASSLAIAHVRLDARGIRERIGTGYYRDGIFTGDGHLVQPAALVRGLADHLPAGIQLHEQSPVLSLRRAGKWRLETPDAEITAGTVIMAANAAIKHLGYLRDRLVTIYTYAAITAPVPERDRACLGAMPTWGVLPVHRLGTTLRRVGRDRLLVRSLYAYERGLSPAAACAALLARFRRRYPELGHVDLEHVWGGTTALTMNGAPWWGRLDDGLYTSAGCNGSGIVKGTVLGKRLAEQIVGRPVGADVTATFGSASWVAPEPFRTIGFKIVSAVARRRAGLES